MTAIVQPLIDNTIIRASAGSGKTTALAARYLKLLASGAHCQSILATTFTRKAAGEILDRIMSGLAVASLDDRAAREFATKLQLLPFDMEAARGLLVHMADNLHRLQIDTLDSFFARLARSFSLEIGLDPDWRIVEERANARLIVEAVGDVLSQGDSIQLLHLMAKGKSLRGAHRELMDTIGKLYSIYLDSTTGAWLQLPDQPILAPEQIAGAIQRLSEVVIDDKRMANARVDDIQRAANADWDEFVSKGLAGKIIDGTNAYYNKSIPIEVSSLYRPLIQHVRGVLQNELKASTEATFHLLDRFHHRFEQIKAEQGALRFDDVTRRLMELVELSDRPTDSDWTYRLDRDIDHLLLDEFQDTSPDQWKVIQPLVRRAAEANSPRSLFCVGDMKQAIFGWRGGVAEVFELVEKLFPTPDARRLDHSYRSAPPVIDTVNRVFENVEVYESKNPLINSVVRKWQARFSPHTTDKVELPGYAVLDRFAEGDDPQTVVVARIKEIYQQSPNRSIAILTPENDQVRRLIFALQLAGVPASEESGNPLTDSAAVLTILSLVRLSDHPDDSASWYHAAHSPLAALVNLPSCVLDRDQTPEIKRQVHEVAAAIRRELGESGYSATVARWATVLIPSCTTRELRRLQKLIELADEYDAEATLRPTDFVEFVEERPVEDPTGSLVRVMTIHKAKGLEFDVVVLPHLSKQFTPHDRDVLILRQAPTDPISLVSRYAGAATRQLLPEEIQRAYEQQFERGMNEAMCVLYVVLTRAIHALHMFVGAKDKPTSQSMAGILLATLTEAGDSSRILFEHGDRDWAEKSPSKSEDESAPGAVARRPRDTQPRKQLVLAKSGMRDLRIRPLISPSHIGSQGTIGESLRRLDNRQAIRRGTILHAGLAEIEWLENDSWRERLIDSVHRRFPDTSLDDTLIAEFVKLLSQPGLRNLLSRASYLDQIARKISSSQVLFEPITLSVEAERSFAVRLDEGIMRGTIDRLVFIRQGNSLFAAEVIEFKSDELSSSDEAQVEQRVAEYLPQTGAYRRAVAAFCGLPLNRVFARLVLVGIDREFEVR